MDLIRSILLQSYANEQNLDCTPTTMGGFVELEIISNEAMFEHSSI
jgi:hypothetical protein